MTEVTVGLANISSRGRHIVQIMSVAAENEEALMIGWLIITRVCMNEWAINISTTLRLTLISLMSE